MQTVRQILTNMKTKYMKKVTIYRLQRLMRQRAQFVAERFRFFTIFCYRGIEKKLENRLRHGTRLMGMMINPGAELEAKHKIRAFLAQTLKYRKIVNKMRQTRFKIVRI